LHKKIKGKPNLIKIDTHSHTAGVSFCSQLFPENYVLNYKTKGVGTVVLTNHYSKQQMSKYAVTFKEQLTRYLNEFYITREAGRSVNVNVLLGAEVAIASKTSPYNEFLLFGATDEFLKSAPPLYDMDQKTLYKTCYDNGVLMYQAHPFRSEHNHMPQDPEFMDGVEINCHPSFNSSYEQIYLFAAKHNLGISCGSDLHYPTQAGYGGIFADAAVKTERDLARYLKANKRPKIFISPKIKIQL
jgi:histidinol phosphatase-like PHP family hydrolase